MNQIKKQPKWKRLLPSVLWTLAGISLFILLVSAMDRNDHLRCSGLEISIEGYKHEMFISEADVKALIEDDLSHKVKGCAIDAMNLRRLEGELQKDNWVSKAQLFVDNKQMLHVNISERLPVARIFTQGNRSYYIDSQAVVLPLSQQQVADVPVFTNMPDRPQKLAGADSLFWQQIGKMGNYIISDSFLLMQVGQINVTNSKELELYPVIGNHLVLLGTPDKYVQKLNRLKKFDVQVLAKAGVNKYSRLDLRYDKQIVAILRGTETALPHQEDIVPEMQIAATQPQSVPAVVHDMAPAVAKIAVKVSEKKTVAKADTKVISSPPKKVTIRQETAKKETKRTEKITEKNTAQIAKKKNSENDKKNLAAASNKTDKNTLKQLSKNVNKVGVTEVDIRKKRAEKKSQQARAVMPKRQ